MAPQLSGNISAYNLFITTLRGSEQSEIGIFFSKNETKILFWFDIGMDVGTRILIGVMREGPLLLAKSYESEKDHCY